MGSATYASGSITSAGSSSGYDGSTTSIASATWGYEPPDLGGVMALDL